jgi:hypothetical protein
LPDTAGMGFIAKLFTPYPRGENPPLTGTRAPRVVTGALLLLASFLVWRELEPNLLFRPVEGIVLGSSVNKVTVYVKRRRTSYIPQIDYRYQVNGQSYLGNRYRRTDIAASRWGAERRARQYVGGSRVQVWYSPTNPADSVLSRSPNPGMFVVFGLSAIMASWIWRKYSRPQDQNDHLSM